MSDSAIAVATAPARWLETSPVISDIVCRGEAYGLIERLFDNAREWTGEMFRVPANISLASRLSTNRTSIVTSHERPTITIDAPFLSAGFENYALTTIRGPGFTERGETIYLKIKRGINHVQLPALPQEGTYQLAVSQLYLIPKLETKTGPEPLHIKVTVRK